MRFMSCFIALALLLAAPAGAQVQRVQGASGGYPVAVTVSGALPAPTGGATAAKQDAQTALLTAGNASTASIDAKLSNQATAALQSTGNATLATLATQSTVAAIQALLAGTISVTGPLTDAQLRASAVPVSLAAVPLPTGAATEATLATRVADATITARWGTLGQKTSAGSAPVVIASDQSVLPVSGPLTDTQLRASAVPVSAAALPLPTGAATAAKQPALGTAGSASADVITVQGIVGATPVKVDGSAVTQPISGTVSATQSGTWVATGASASGAAVSGNPLLVAGSDGTNARTLSTDTSGRLKPAGGTNFYNCPGVNETRTLKSGAGILRRVIINPGSGGSSLTLYDNTAASGTQIHSVTTSSAGALPFVLEYNLAFGTGLTYVTATGTQANITFVYERRGRGNRNRGRGRSVHRRDLQGRRRMAA